MGRLHLLENVRVTGPPYPPVEQKRDSFPWGRVAATVDLTGQHISMLSLRLHDCSVMHHDCMTSRIMSGHKCNNGHDISKTRKPHSQHVCPLYVSSLYVCPDMVQHEARKVLSLRALLPLVDCFGSASRPTPRCFLCSGEWGRESNPLCAQRHYQVAPLLKREPVFTTCSG